MDNLVILAVGNAIFWIAAFVLIFTIAGRQQGLEEKLNALEQGIQDDTELQTE